MTGRGRLAIYAVTAVVWLLLMYEIFRPIDFDSPPWIFEYTFLLWVLLLVGWIYSLVKRLPHASVPLLLLPYSAIGLYGTLFVRFNLDQPGFILGGLVAIAIAIGLTVVSSIFWVAGGFSRKLDRMSGPAQEAAGDDNPHRVSRPAPGVGGADVLRIKRVIGLGVLFAMFLALSPVLLSATQDCKKVYVSTTADCFGDEDGTGRCGQGAFETQCSGVGPLGVLLYFVYFLPCFVTVWRGGSRLGLFFLVNLSTGGIAAIKYGGGVFAWVAIFVWIGLLVIAIRQPKPGLATEAVSA